MLSERTVVAVFLEINFKVDISLFCFLLRHRVLFHQGQMGSSQSAENEAITTQDDNVHQLSSQQRWNDEDDEQQGDGGGSLFSMDWANSVNFKQAAFHGVVFFVGGVVADIFQQTMFEPPKHVQTFKKAYKTLIPCLSKKNHSGIASYLLDLVFCMTSLKTRRMADSEKNKARLLPPLEMQPAEDRIWRSMCAKIGMILGQQQSFFMDYHQAEKNGTSIEEVAIPPEVEEELLVVFDAIKQDLIRLEPYCISEHSDIWTRATDNLKREITEILSSMFGRRV